MSKKLFVSLHFALALIALTVTLVARAENQESSETQSVVRSLVSSQAELLIPGTVEVSPRDSYSLYDITEVRAGNDELFAELKTRFVKVSDGRIARSSMLQSLKGLKAKFVIPDYVKVLVSNQPVSRLELERKIRSELLSRCNECEFQIHVQSVPKSIEANWTLDLNGDLNRETIMVPIRSARTDSENSNWVIAEVKRFAEIPVAARPIAPNTSIDSTMYKMERRIVRATADVIMREEDLVGMQSTRNLISGQTFSARDLKKDQVVRKSQIVKALVNRDGFEVSISAVAEDSGGIGDTIRVRNLDSQKVFAAEITGRGMVKLD